MLPSPSLGPPLLSASWSPPLFCGIPAVELDAPEPLPEADAAGADAGVEELLLDPPPQPATASARATTAAPVAASKRDLRMTSFLSRERHTSGRGLARSPVAVRGCAYYRGDAGLVQPAPKDLLNVVRSWPPTPPARARAAPALRRGVQAPPASPAACPATRWSARRR